MKFSNQSVLSFILLCFLTGCVSSMFKEKIPPFSKALTYTAPKKPFGSIGNNSYPSWKSKDTNNVILIISNCDQTIAGPESAHLLLSENIESVQVSDVNLNSFTFTQLKTKSYTRFLTGNLDDAPIAIKTFSFRYKDCLYISALSGKPSTLEKDEQTWKSFLSSIELK